MVPQTPKVSVMISPQTVTSTGTLSGYVDTRGFDYAEILLVASTTDAPTNNPTLLYIREHDTTTSATSMTAITAFAGDGASGFTVASWSSTVDNSTLFCIDLKGRKRYLGIAISPLTTHTLTAVANLYRGDEMPIGTTAANVINLVTG